MGTCCLEECYYSCEEYKDKCILHCQKDDWSKSNDKIKLFWTKINKEIDGVNYANEEFIYSEINYEFEKIIFPKYIDTDSKPFLNLDKKTSIKFKECIFLDSIDFSLLLKAKNVYFSNDCTFFENIEFVNQIFSGFFIFEGCKVHKDIKFQNIVFNKTTSFIDSEFHQEFTFIHTRFEGLALFNQVKADILLFDNSYFSVESNFLDIKAKMADRETARIIKNSFEKENNIIEANKFYALEMEKKEEELIKNWFSKDFFELIIFKLHRLSSNYSQDYILPLFWIFNISIFYLMYTSTLHHHQALMTIQIVVVFLFLFIHKINILLFLTTLVFYSLSYIEIDSISDKINPFSIMTSNDTLTFGLLLFKTTIAYLIYQFIVSVRQNTRRK